MLDLIKLFFLSLRAAFASLNQPSPAVGVRWLQWSIIACFLAGTISFASSIYLLFVFNGATATWFWMLVGGAGLWTIGACLGDIVAKVTDEVHA